IANARVYILDGRGEPSPAGVAGELDNGGAGVGGGYFDRSDLTGEAFVSDPFEGDRNAGGRVDKHGGVGGRLGDGTNKFRGRNDFQVKIRGFRVELGEIEARLSDLPWVRDVVVVAREDEPGEKRLVAYYTCVEEDQGQREGSAGARELRQYLMERFPEYM